MTNSNGLPGRSVVVNVQNNVVIPGTNTPADILTAPLVGFIPTGTAIMIAVHVDAVLTAGGELPQVEVRIDTANGPNPALTGAVEGKANFSGVNQNPPGSQNSWVSADFVMLMTGLVPGSPISMTLTANVQGGGNPLTTINNSSNQGMVVLNGLNP
jgi:hypothetical protein